MKSGDIKEDEYEEIQPEFISGNLIMNDTMSDQIDIISDFYKNIDNIQSIKNNAEEKKNKVKKSEKDVKVNDNLLKNEITTILRKQTEIAEVIDEIQEEVDNFKITNFLNDDCKFRVNVNDSDSNEGANYNNDDSYDSTIENTENREDNEFEEEVKDEVNIVVNSNNIQETKKDEQIKRIKECIEKIKFYMGKCISLIGENRFNELYNYYYSLNDVKTYIKSRNKDLTT